METVHPHRCGENLALQVSLCAHDGSPPQVWGKLICFVKAIISAWFTPTGVGKTAHTAFYGANIAVHPHRCGENRRFRYRRRNV